MVCRASACGPVCYSRDFIAKAMLGLLQTNMLIERLIADKLLRRICGWEDPGRVPEQSDLLPRLRRIR
jgi:hypothetical protein